jgi:sulfatase maturation enzyme AslB (radical SAM superfamily)
MLNPKHSEEWLITPEGKPRGYIQPNSLSELWFHTGTICNLECPFCFEGSCPGDDRIPVLTYDDAQPFIEEALSLGVQKFCFTGGEPFVIRDIIAILRSALQNRPSLVLTNATEPLIKRLPEILALANLPNPLSFRISIDYPDAEMHDRGRGKGNFSKAWATAGQLSRYGFRVSIARQYQAGEDSAGIELMFRTLIKQAGLPEDTMIVSFPDLHLPFSTADVPAITENCMTSYKTEQERAAFMCNHTKMVVKRRDGMAVYACTLVDDDDDFVIGRKLHEAMPERIMLKHHRCFTCFASGTSCSE